MRARRFAFVATLFAIGLVVAIPQGARADASDSLRQVLSTLRGLGVESFKNVVTWAANGAPQVVVPIQDYEQAEAQILNLGSDDRQAMLWWLRGNGRSALYARGATDDQIGPLRSGVDSGAAPAATPTPNPWRDLKLASATLGGSTPASNIVVLGGFAAAKVDGTSVKACVSFKNVAPLAAVRVLFRFPLLNAGGDVVGALQLDRKGIFSPNVEIASYGSMSDAQGFGSNRNFADNCTTITNGVAAVPILTARYATYRVTHVEYADGSVWPKAGASIKPRLPSTQAIGSKP